MNYKNKYPFIFIHGMLGWGEEDLMYKMPYWGMVCGNLMKQLRAEGYEAYAPKVGPVDSAWARACELYAILAGTTVDYGVAHSKKMGHNRFGRTYDKPLVPGWGEEKKVHLLGHSFGGVTIRLLTELLANGSEEERNATDPDDLSPLFAGGHEDWVASITSVSSPHDGTTFVHAFPNLMKGLTVGLLGLFSILGNTGANRFYDNYLERYDLTSVPGTTNLKRIIDPAQIVRIGKIIRSGDHVFHDLRIDAADEINKTIHCSKGTYYFSVTGRGTKPSPENPENEIRDKIMLFAFIPFAKKLGSFPEQTIGEVHVDASWHANDGLVPVESGRYPHREPHVFYEDVKDRPLEKGVWHVLPDYIADHGTVIGGSLSYIGPGKAKPFRDYYRNHLNLLISLE